MKYDVTKGGYILLGRCGENLARTVEIDVSEYLKEYPGAVVTLLHRRHGESGIYPVAAELRDGCLVWQPTSADTAIAGSGEAEVRVTVDGVLAKSKILSTMVDKSLTGQETDVPEASKGWVDAVISAVGNVQNMKAEAESVAYGEPATAEYDGKTGTMHFGIPEGRPGRDGKNGAPGAKGDTGGQGPKGEPGSDASVTAKNIQSALGYTPADKVLVDQLTQEIAELKGGTEQTTNVVARAGYVKYATGAISSDSGGWNTGYVETAGFEKAEYHGRMNSGGAVLAFYDVNKLYLQNDSVAGSPDGINWVSGTVSIPADAAYTIVSSYGTGSGSNNGGKGYLRLFSEGSSGIAGLEADIADLTDKVNPIKGKRFAVLGDSISSLSYTLPVWWQLIAEKYGCSFENYGVSASRIAVSDSETPSFIERYAAMDDAVDGVVVVGGTNDAWYTPIGTFDSADNTTLNGALNEMLPALLNKYPGKPVLFFAPIQREDYTEGDYPVTIADLKTLDVTTAIGRDRVNLAIMVKCRQYGVPCVDLYTACGINGNDANSVYFRTDDNLHPSKLGMQRIAGVVAAELVKHFNFVD